MNEEFNGGVRRGFWIWPGGNRELQAVAFLSPVGPNYPEGLAVFAPFERTQEPQAQAMPTDRGQILAQLDELAEAISRHVKASREAIAMIDFGNSPTRPS